MISPDLEQRVGRRPVVAGLLKTAGALTLASIPTILIAPRVQAVEHYELSSATPVRPFRYYPGGRGLAEPLQKLTEAHLRLSQGREDFRGNTELLYNSLNSPDCLNNSACGLCNGGSNRLASELLIAPPTIEVAGINFNREEIEAIGTVYHVGDQVLAENFRGRDYPIPEGENPDDDGRSEPFFLHWMIRKYLGEQRTPFVLDRSEVKYKQVWSHPVDRAVLDVRRMESGSIQVQTTLFGGEYIEAGGDERSHRQMVVHYEINENDPTNPGNWNRQQGDINSARAWKPDWKLGGVNPEHPRYRVRDEVLPPPIGHTYLALVGYHPPRT